MQLDPAQFKELVSAISEKSQIFTFPTAISSFAALIALTSARFSYLTYRRTRRQYIADLHGEWWSRDFEEDRAIVWQELQKWKEMGEASPVIRHYANPDNGWGVRSEERRAHGRILFFFADLNTFIKFGLVDKNLVFELFGVAQYDWFREYIHAIMQARKIRLGPGNKDAIEPRWIGDIMEFERMLDTWKVSKL